LDSRAFIQIASVTKLYTLAAAVEVLGAGRVFETTFVYTGTLDEVTGALDGNLILVASGDLTMRGRNNSDGTVEYTDLITPRPCRSEGLS